MPSAHSARRRVLAVAVLAVALTMPAASATHLVLSSATGDDSPWRTLEDDGAEVYRPGNAFHGLQNRVVLAGEPGDDGLFLDARVATLAGASDRNLGATYTVGTQAPTGSLFAGVLGRPDILLPGEKHVSAWYGEWSDANSDGVIDDVHDLCSCADEFKWRGHATNEPDIALLFAYLPRQGTGYYLSGLPHEDARNALGGNMFYLEDHTRVDNEEQSWRGVVFRNLDGGSITTLTTIVIADAIRVQGSQTLFSLTDPNALYDVDVYEAVNPDVNALYLSSAAFVDDLVREARGGAIPFTQYVGGLVQAAVAEALASLPPDAVTHARSQVEAPYPREPNTTEDDYGDAALFRGSTGGCAGDAVACLGDIEGSYNTYAGYAERHRLFYDHMMRTAACVRGYASVPGAGEQTVNVHCPSASYAQPQGTSQGTGNGANPVAHLDPLGAQQGSRSGGLVVTFQAILFLWHDANGDGYVGRVCDPANPDEFDAERGVCRTAPPTWPGYAGSEGRSICHTSDAPGNTLTVSPLDSWPQGTLLLRDYAEPTRPAFATSAEPLAGAQPAMVRYEDSCAHAGGVNPSMRARDALLLPPGFDVPLRVESRVSVGPYEDQGTGLLMPGDSVLDVDYYVPTL